nr:hypothetical protein [Candidatus Sigynarchaeota archaeon]
MEKRFFWMVNAIFITLLPAWLIIKAATLGFDLGFSWAPQPDLFVSYEFTYLNMAILFTSAFWMAIIGLMLLKRYRERKKDMPLLLAMFNLVLAGGFAWDGIRKYTTYNDIYRNAVEAIVFVCLAWALVFFFLFLQDVFTGSYAFKDHKRADITCIILISTSVFFFLGWPDLMPLVVSTYMAYAVILAIIVPLGAWQIRTAFRLAKKTEDQRSRIGISMIGYSAIFYLAIIAIIAFKKLFFPLDLLLSIFILALSVATYMGFIYPSRKPKS